MRNDAKAVAEAKRSVEVRMYQNGKSITEIMAVTRRNYERVKEVLDLAEVEPRSLRALVAGKRR